MRREREPELRLRDVLVGVALAILTIVACMCVGFGSQ